MKVLDCLGHICPIPYLLFSREINSINIGEQILVIIDHSCAKEKIENHCLKNKLEFSTFEPINGIWEITITK